MGFMKSLIEGLGGTMIFLVCALSEANVIQTDFVHVIFRKHQVCFYETFPLFLLSMASIKLEYFFQDKCFMKM
jgi:hypothetical protein